MNGNEWADSADHGDRRAEDYGGLPKSSPDELAKRTHGADEMERLQEMADDENPIF